MTANVKLLPSGHEFTLEAGETILDAALRNGLSVRYNCSSGSCGDCKAKLVAGEVEQIGHFDYVFKGAEKDAGMVLLCRCTASGPVMLEAVEARGADDVPYQSINTTVCNLTPLSDDIMEVAVRTPRSKTLWFLAGQHVTLKLGDLPDRNKSVASCPCNGRILQFHVRRVAGDPFPEYVFNQLKTRETVQIEGPQGRFILDEESTRPIIFLAYETGFAPIKSLIEHAISLEIPQAMRLYWVAKAEGDHYMANYCRSWQDALDDFRFVPICADQASEDAALQELAACLDTDALTEREHDLIKAAAQIIADYPDLSGFDIYVNGPDAVLLPLRLLFARHGLPGERLFVDAMLRY